MARQERWQLAGSAPEVYAQDLVPAIFGPWAPILVELATPKPGERVVDIACGTGVVARAAAERVGPAGRVVGVDLNPGMLVIARSQVGSSTAAPIEWREASAEALPLPDDSCDIAYCQLGLQYFPDRPRALNEMRRVLSPGGRVALLVWGGIDHSPGFAALAGALDRYVSAAAGAVMRAPFVMENVAEIESLLAAAGFREIVIGQRVGTVRFASVERMVQCQVAGSPLAAHLAATDETKREALLAEMTRATREYVGDEGFAFPIAAHLARASA